MKKYSHLIILLCLIFSAFDVPAGELNQKGSSKLSPISSEEDKKALPFITEPKPKSAYLDLTKDCEAPAISKMAFPSMPKEAFNSRQQGWVTYYYEVVGEKAVNIRVLASSPEGVYEDAAIEALRKVVFKAKDKKSCAVFTSKFTFQ